jgi:hypothetical protein
MSNSCYLCSSPWDEIYPNRLPGFTPEAYTVACDVNTVPLLWLAGFRAQDLRRRTLDLGDERRVAIAPVAKITTFESQLRSALPSLRTLFPGTILEDHAALLVEAVRATVGSFVTIEWAEIESQDDPVIFREAMRRVFAFFESPGQEIHRSTAARAKENALPEIEKLHLLRSAFPHMGLMEAKTALTAAGGSLSEAYQIFAAQRSPLEEARASWGKKLYHPKPDFGDLLLEFCGLRVGAGLAPPRRVLTADSPFQASLCKFMGTQHERPVPWE